MDIEKDIIQDQKETIHRLQEECKEKTDIIMALGQKAFIKNPVEAYEKLLKENAELKKYEYYYLDKFIDLKQALEEIRDIASETGCLKFVEIVNEVLGNE